MHLIAAVPYKIHTVRTDNVLSAEMELAVKASLFGNMLLLRDVGQVIEPGGFHRQGKRSRP
ncbi:hypothetical protein NKI20_24320 [Mesorhizobium sp. M0830]|uniref:hypothetical protein n=1 Tax=Mesorhizobium sp. M0830 TaxID=2957008 RepID=UPI00333825DC